ncbi:MAG: hypothetical protein ACXWKM_07165 [Phenylobacterium sp.]
MDDASLRSPEASTGSAVRRLLGKLRPEAHTTEVLRRATRGAAATASRQARSAADFSARRIRTYPVTSAAVALGAGFLQGAMLSPRKWFGARPQSAQKADRHAVQEPL